MTWISIEERLPEDDQTVLVWQYKQTAALPLYAYFDDEAQTFILMDTLKEVFLYASHWMPLPSPPIN